MSAKEPFWWDISENNDLMLQVAQTEDLNELNRLLEAHKKAKHGGGIARTCHPCMIITQKIMNIEELGPRRV